MDACPQKIHGIIDARQSDFIGRLADAVSIKSISAAAEHRPEVIKMSHWMARQLEDLGATVEIRDVGKQVLEGTEIGLPPVLLGRMGNDPDKLNLLVYGHLDVQPAEKADGWETEPFTLTVMDDGRMVGRGSSDDKGPVLGWLNVIQAHKEAGIELPVNLLFCFEAMEESGSEGLDELIQAEAKSYFKDVDVVCISDNYWLDAKTPCLTYGLRGIQAFQINVEGPAKDLHSGLYGGMVHEPMTDPMTLMSKLVDTNGHIQIPGIMNTVAKLSDEERARYEKITYSISDLEAAVGSSVQISQDIVTLLMAKMRYPSLSIHGIEGAFSQAGFKTVIPARVNGKFSIRLVPDMQPDQVCKLVRDYIEEEAKKLNSKCTISLDTPHGGKPWVADPNHYNYVAGSRATKNVYGVEPEFLREGGSIPVTLTFADSLGVNVLLLPMGRGDDGAHSVNEKLDKTNFIKGTHMFASYLHELAALHKAQKDLK